MRALGFALLLATSAAPAPTPAPTPPVTWQWPLTAPVVTHGFDPPSSPYGAGHRGVDMAAPPGSPVYAAAGGVVGYAGPLAGRGVVSVSVGSLRYTYEPVRPAVRVGQPVNAGSLIGWLVAGHPGCPEPACLHWGVLSRGRYIDPLSLVVARARLLPRWTGAPSHAASRWSATTHDTKTAASRTRHGSGHAVGALFGIGAGTLTALSRRRWRPRSVG